MNWSKYFLLFLGAIGWWLFAIYSTVLSFNYLQEKSNAELETSNTALKNEINELSAWSVDKINQALSFYKEYFQKRSEIYILDIFWLLEYVIPDNNFVQSLSLTKNSITITLSFQAKTVQSLIKLYYNLEQIKSKNLIEKYSISDISLNQREWLKSAEQKTYKIDIWINPNVDRKIIVEFLKTQDSSYRKIYDNYLNEVIYSWEKMTDKINIQQAIENVNTQNLSWDSLSWNTLSWNTVLSWNNLSWDINTNLLTNWTGN